MSQSPINFDLSCNVDAFQMPKVKVCKSGRHHYIGHTRCPACKKEYDARWERSVKGRRTRRAYRLRRRDYLFRKKLIGRGAFVSGMPMPPLYTPKPRIVYASVIDTTGI